MKIYEICPGNHKPGPKRHSNPRTAKTRLLVDLRAMREQYNLSLRDVHKATGIGVATLLRTEQGATPSLEKALQIAGVFGLPVENVWAVRDVREAREARKRGR